MYSRATCARRRGHARPASKVWAPPPPDETRPPTAPAKRRVYLSCTLYVSESISISSQSHTRCASRERESVLERDREHDREIPRTPVTAHEPL